MGASDRLGAVHVLTALDPMMTPLLTAIASDQIDPEKLRPGWLGGAFAFGLMFLVALLMWSFAVMARRARQPWPGEDDDTTTTDADSEANGQTSRDVGDGSADGSSGPR